jgi:peptide/nickel transport system substrate-binding protein
MAELRENYQAMSESESDPGKAFDRQMAAYLWKLRQQALSRRGVLRLAAGSLGAAAMGFAVGIPTEAAGTAFLPGLSVLQIEDGTFTFGLEGDVRGLEPALAYDFTANPVACQISEGLLMFDAEGRLQPLLAEKWEHPDALTYTYTLREGITFHDGSPVTVDDVIASIARVRDPEVAGPLAWMYDGPEATVERVDDRTVTIRLKTPSALFQYVPATTAGHVIPKAAIETYGLDLLRNPIGTGPYKFVKWDAGSEIELEKNTEYWQEGKPYFDRVVFKIIEEGTTRVTAEKNGEINAMTQVPADQLDVVKGFENVDFQEIVGYGINGITLRNDSPPFDDLKVRQAVNYAVDIDAIMTNIVRDAGIRARNTTVPPDMLGSAANELEPVPYDLEKAKQLMAESSQPNGFSTRLAVIAPSPVWLPQAIAVQEALKELNIEVEIDQMPYADWISLQQAGDYEGMMSYNWASDFPDAAGNLIPLFHSRNFPPQNNHAYYNNPEVDGLLDASEAELDEEKRQQMLVDAQKLIAADQPWIFFEHNKWYMPMTKGITGYKITALWYWDAFTRDLKPA